MRRAWLSALSFVGLGLLTSAASAQVAEGVALDRYEPSERGSDWFANESLDLRGKARPALGLIIDWGHKPLVLYDERGDNVVAKVVENQLFAHIGGGVVLGDRLRLAANLPVLLYTNGDSGISGTTTYATQDGTHLGDLRFGADLRLLGTYGQPFTLAVGAQLFVPTGNREAYASDGSVRLRPRLMAAGDIGPFAYAAQVGFTYRALDQDFNGEAFGSEFLFSGAAGLRFLDHRVIIGPELFGTTVITKSSAVFDRRTTPFELIFGGKFAVSEDVRVGAGVGPGLTRGFGAPELRVLASLEWFPSLAKEPPPPPSDRDRDGIIDVEDACPDQKGPPNDDPKKNGCPPPPDRDHDGIIDPEDACPDQKGPANEDPKKNGCPPPPDRDGDGIIDVEDACPDQKGPPNDDPKKNGCPPPADTDGDGIPDPVDACPDVFGTPSEDPKKNGCPKAILTETKIEILERVEFDHNKATLRPESDGILSAVLKVMVDHAEINRISVEGHTDNTGGRAYNADLSKRRAASVVKWMVDHGVDASRLSSIGYGQDKPIDDNKTDEGRQNNRRVEFRVVARIPVPAADGAPASGSAPDPTAPKPPAASPAVPKAAAPAQAAPKAATPATVAPKATPKVEGAKAPAAPTPVLKK